MRFAEGAVALVTGGSRGIGRATALALAQHGVTVAVNYRENERAAKSVVEEITATGGAAHLAKADIADEVQVREMFRSLRTSFGRLDVVVANAGVTDDGLATVMSSSKFDRVLDVNLRGTFLVCREALRIMMDKRRGSIITVASSSGIQGVPGQANYCASKGGIVSMSKALADEAARCGVRVNVVAPGYIETDMSRRVRQDLKEVYRQRIPLGRFAEPDEVASVVCFLSSELASYVTGEVVRVDGGLII